MAKVCCTPTAVQSGEKNGMSFKGGHDDQRPFGTMKRGQMTPRQQDFRPPF
jgi:hypothetical protein